MSNFLDRLVEEERELKAKIVKLDDFVYSEGFYKLEDRDHWLLQDQLSSMRHYQGILRQRIARANEWVKHPEQTQLEPVMACGNS